MADAEPGKDRIIQELITHINSLEQKINMLKDELSEENDMQTVNRLDIINLKNELDKIRISVPVLSPDVIEKIKDMEKLADKRGRAGGMQGIAGDVEQLKKALHGLRPEVIEEMQGEISALYDMVSKHVSEKPEKTRQHPEVSELKKRLDELEGRAAPAPKCRKCGAALRPGARFCGKCGSKFE